MYDGWFYLVFLLNPILKILWYILEIKMHNNLSITFFLNVDIDLLTLM